MEPQWRNDALDAITFVRTNLIRNFLKVLKLGKLFVLTGSLKCCHFDEIFGNFFQKIFFQKNICPRRIFINHRTGYIFIHVRSRGIINIQSCKQGKKHNKHPQIPWLQIFDSTYYRWKWPNDNKKFFWKIISSHITLFIYTLRVKLFQRKHMFQQ